jgi:anti-sigma regulatory factor (Ser/Thr protein kinase)
VPTTPAALAPADDLEHPLEHHVINLDGCDKPTNVARDGVRAALADTAGPDRTDDAVLVADELVVNAVQHTGGPVRLVIDVYRDSVLLWVCDRAPDCAAVCSRTAPETAQDGRGLHIVGELTDKRFVWPTEDGKAVVGGLSLFLLTRTAPDDRS